MLSLHEVAALLLVKDGHALKKLDHAELDALRRYRLITLEYHESTHPDAHVTDRGDSVLRAMARKRPPIAAGVDVAGQ